MTYFKRNESGSLTMRSLDLQILIADMFEVAKDESEIEWILENLQTVIEIASEEQMERLTD